MQTNVYNKLLRWKCCDEIMHARIRQKKLFSLIKAKQRLGERRDREFNLLLKTYLYCYARHIRRWNHSASFLFSHANVDNIDLELRKINPRYFICILFQAFIGKLSSRPTKRRWKIRAQRVRLVSHHQRCRPTPKGEQLAWPRSAALPAIPAIIFRHRQDTINRKTQHRCAWSWKSWRDERQQSEPSGATTVRCGSEWNWRTGPHRSWS